MLVWSFNRILLLVCWALWGNTVKENLNWCQWGTVSCRKHESMRKSVAKTDCLHHVLVHKPAEPPRHQKFPRTAAAYFVVLLETRLQDVSDVYFFQSLCIDEGLKPLLITEVRVLRSPISAWEHQLHVQEKKRTDGTFQGVEKPRMLSSTCEGHGNIQMFLSVARTLSVAELMGATICLPISRTAAVASLKWSRPTPWTPRWFAPRRWDDHPTLPDYGKWEYPSDLFIRLDVLFVDERWPNCGPVECLSLFPDAFDKFRSYPCCVLQVLFAHAFVFFFQFRLKFASRGLRWREGERSWTEAYGRSRPTSLQVPRAWAGTPPQTFSEHDASTSPDGDGANTHALWPSGKVWLLRTGGLFGRVIIVIIVAEEEKLGHKTDDQGLTKAQTQEMYCVTPRPSRRRWFSERKSKQRDIRHQKAQGNLSVKGVRLKAKGDVEEEPQPFHKGTWSIVPCPRDLPDNVVSGFSKKTAWLTRHAGKRESGGALSWTRVRQDWQNSEPKPCQRTASMSDSWKAHQSNKERYEVCWTEGSMTTRRFLTQRLRRLRTISVPWWVFKKWRFNENQEDQYQVFLAWAKAGKQCTSHSCRHWIRIRNRSSSRTSTWRIILTNSL